MSPPVDVKADSTKAAILPLDVPRSDADDGDDDDHPSLHPLLGTFADPKQEKAFGAWCFRTAFQLHVALMALMFLAMVLGSTDVTGKIHPEPGVAIALGLAARVWVHYRRDPVDAQRLGAAAWAGILVLVQLSTVVENLSCKMGQEWEYALAGFAVGVVNGTHGMVFRFKASLVTMVVASDLTSVVLAARTCPGVSSRALLSMILGFDLPFLMGFVLTHAAELLLRQNSAKAAAQAAQERRAAKEARQLLNTQNQWLTTQNDRLLAQNDRLSWSVQLTGQGGLRPDDDRSAVRRGLQAQPAALAPRAAAGPSGDPYSLSSASLPTDDARSSVAETQPEAAPTEASVAPSGHESAATSAAGPLLSFCTESETSTFLELDERANMPMNTEEFVALRRMIHHHTSLHSISPEETVVVAVSSSEGAGPSGSCEGSAGPSCEGSAGPSCEGSAGPSCEGSAGPSSGGPSGLPAPAVAPSVSGSETTTAEIEAAMQQLGVMGFVQAMEQQRLLDRQQAGMSGLQLDVEAASSVTSTRESAD